MLSKKLREARQLIGLTQQAMADKIGVNRVVIVAWEKGDYKPTEDNLAAFAAVVGKPLSWFYEVVPLLVPKKTGNWPRIPLEKLTSEEEEDTVSADIARIPILGTVPGGNPIEAIELIEGYIAIPKMWSNSADYALRVKGESMAPRIIPGDVVLVRKQEYFEDGQIVIALMDNEATIKRAYHTPQGITLKDFSGNEWHNGGHITIIGRVVKNLAEM